MPKRAKKRAAPTTQPETLKCWQQIAAFLGEPTSVVQRWASEGMPVRRQGRYVETTHHELNAWLGKESGKPVHVATENTDLTAELKRGLSFVRREKEPNARTELGGGAKKAKRK
jgi:phage terminase Nu1 subunit (DNA packaging protein)